MSLFVEDEFRHQRRAEPQPGTPARMVGFTHGAVHRRHTSAVGNGNADGITEPD